MTRVAAGAQIVYWHRELPPLEADVLDEYAIEADSVRVPGTLAHRDELWERCRIDLATRAASRLEQEVVRLRGHYAHVFDERIDTKRNEAAGVAWLHGRFRYTLYL